jgi:hypothetical protein
VRARFLFPIISNHTVIDPMTAGAAKENCVVALSL